MPVTEEGRKEAISAEYRDGILKVHLPKSEKAKQKLIEVTVS